MASLYWDLTRNATRAHLLEATLAELSATDRAAVLTAMETCKIPDTHHHNLAEVLASIDAAVASDQVKSDARAIYRILAEAEATAHGCAVEETHFHEVGNGAAIRNVFGICGAIEALAPEGITATSVQTGRGTVQCAHGLLAIPAPATAATLARGIPVCTVLFDGELCTPTSAAIIYHFVDEYIHD